MALFILYILMCIFQICILRYISFTRKHQYNPIK